MSNILTEGFSKDRVVKAWIKRFGTPPDINSAEFKTFNKELNRRANQEYQQKMAGSESLDSFARKLVQIASKAPDKFPQELSNAFSNIRKKDQTTLIKMISEDATIRNNYSPWLNLLTTMLSSGKSESVDKVLKALMESTTTKESKYPWLRDLIGKRLVMTEDDFDLNSLDIPGLAATSTSDVSSTDTTTNTTDTATDTDFGTEDGMTPTADDTTSDFTPDDVPHIAPAGGGSYEPADGNDDADAVNFDPNAPEYRVIDVMFDDKHPEASPKVKVQDVKTGKVEIKNLYEVDV